MTDDDLARNVLALRSFARSLAHGIDAEDLVQDVAVAALRLPEHPSRAWLRSVLRRVAALGRRRRQRQIARDALLVPVSEVMLDDEAFRAQLVDALQEALRELDTPSRDALRERFVEGRPAAEIARRAGCPASTIRSRLAVAIEHLRRALDRRFGGRAQWCPALALVSEPSMPKLAVWAPAIAAAALALAFAARSTSAYAPVDPRADRTTATLASRASVVPRSRVATRASVPEASDDGSAQPVAATTPAGEFLERTPLDDARAEDAILDGKLFSPQFKEDLMPLIRECHATRRSVVPDLAGRFGGAFYLRAAPDIGLIVEDVEFLEENEVDDPEFLECVRHSAFSMPFPPTTATGHNKVRLFLDLE